MRLILVLLLAFQGRPSAPSNDPNHDLDDPNSQLIYEGDATPKDGNLVVPFSGTGLYKRPPSCSFSGGTIPGQRPQITDKFAKIKVKKRVKTHYKCEGLKKNTEEHGA